MEASMVSREKSRWKQRNLLRLVLHLLVFNLLAASPT
jgi:hypothetical protein